MIVDCFGFLDEFDLLEGRLKYLWDVVDYFVLIEGNTTFTGIDKPRYFSDNRNRFLPYLSKILYVPVDNKSLGLDFTNKVAGYTEGSSPTILERHQRNAAIPMLKKFSPWDMVMTGDLDEVPNKTILRTYLNIIKRDPSRFSELKTVALRQTCFYYNFKQAMLKPWVGTVLAGNHETQETTPQKLRDDRWNLPALSIGTHGWHLSYFMDAEKIVEKLKSFVHQEYNQPPYTDVKYIQSMIDESKDFLKKDIFVPYPIGNLPKSLVESFPRGVA